MSHGGLSCPRLELDYAAGQCVALAALRADTWIGPYVDVIAAFAASSACIIGIGCTGCIVYGRTHVCALAEMPRSLIEIPCTALKVLLPLRFMPVPWHTHCFANTVQLR